MRVFRLKKNYYGQPGAEPIPDVVYQMGAEVAARYLASVESENQAYGAINPYEQIDMYNRYYVPMSIEENYFDEGAKFPMGGYLQHSPPLNFIAPSLGSYRSRSHKPYFNSSGDYFSRAGSPTYFDRYRSSSPAHYRQQSLSPQLIRSGSSSHVPFIPPVSSSPADIARRLQRAQLSQDIQRMGRYQGHQQEIMLTNAGQFVPEYQQSQMPYYSMNPITQQPQMYPFYY
ncbi:unnamed protein product [Rotaria sordida]|uniref:Uncharacterized protein n=1 Tax=Rotaria sordida TaxID=392033 RepID=A0A814QV68_9BILA|nr:unnamed protein product [Rotaria sordida]CAF1124842.1 unnamed protein product [Rotaria sordida]CAF3660041.1 unnamed protein product [Rotaria sordida]CAF3673517.1 unnamed protein product [Rotaria sordida]